MTHVASEPKAPLNAHAADESPRKDAESPSRAAEATAKIPFESIDSTPVDQRRFERVAIPVVVLFWAVQFVWFTLDRLVRDPGGENWATFQARIIVTAVGVIISFLILRILERSTGASFLKRALLAIALALAGATINSIINTLVFWTIVGPQPGEPISLAMFRAYLPSLIYFFSWFYLAIAVILLSLTYGQELLHRERRIAELRGDADRARLAALRYQLNPHFLFNALNSAASLVSSQRNREAELMLENLADFLRATLELDARSEITLRDELAFQSLYLEMEKIRFPHRLRVEQDVPEELQDVLVPNLLTQPLIENAIKHAVAQSTRPVCLKITAREAAGKLHIEIRDDGGDVRASVTAGSRIGLQNVAARLKLHFGESAHFEAGPTAGGGFETRVSIPIQRRRG